MSAYLLLRCGDCEMLLDVDCVEEVGLVDRAQDSSGMRQWRGMTLPVLDLVALLGVGSADRQQVVIREQGVRCIVEVEEIGRLLSVDARSWQAFPAITPEAERFFDAALAEENGRCLLRLRRPLAALCREPMALE